MQKKKPKVAAIDDWEATEAICRLAGGITLKTRKHLVDLIEMHNEVPAETIEHMLDDLEEARKKLKQMKAMLNRCTDDSAGVRFLTNRRTRVSPRLRP
jgi:hypothetical protein